MIVEFSRLIESIPSEETSAWMQEEGTNHVKIAKFWKDNPASRFSNDFRTVVGCIKYELRKDTPSRTVVKRLWSRAKALRKSYEEETLSSLIDAPTELEKYLV